MQVQLRDGNSDFGKLRRLPARWSPSVDARARCSASARRSVRRCQLEVEVDRIKAQTLHVTTDQIFSTLSSYMGSTFVNQFNKFGRTFQV
jgi:HAE1 family hydrophobic/amphiphilic exporter-1